MITFLFIITFLLALLWLLAMTKELRTPLGTFLILSYLGRLPLHWVTRNVALFSHGVGGDWILYEMLATYIARKWEHQGIHYVTNEDIGYTSLPPNMFAVLVYFNGGPTSLGCTALVALAVCMTALTFYRLGIELEVDPKIALQLTVVFFASPAVVFYSSDMFKDGLVLMFVLGAVASGIRLSRKFSVLDVLLGSLSLWALWYIRYYMVFLASGPFLIGFIGLRARGWVRTFLVVVVFAAGIALAVQSGATKEVANVAQRTFALGVDKNVLHDNTVSGGSGVQFAGTGIAAYPTKLLYTLFSPFPWMPGSLAFQIGKIDTIFFYYVMYRSFLAARKLWKEDRVLLGMLAAFIVPTTLAYATTMANIGLMLRQRLPIVAAFTLLAMRSWPKAGSVPVKLEKAPSGVPARRVRVPIRRPARIM